MSLHNFLANEYNIPPHAAGELYQFFVDIEKVLMGNYAGFNLWCMQQQMEESTKMRDSKLDDSLSYAYYRGRAQAYAELASCIAHEIEQMKALKKNWENSIDV